MACTDETYQALVAPTNPLLSLQDAAARRLAYQPEDLLSYALPQLPPKLQVVVYKWMCRLGKSSNLQAVMCTLDSLSDLAQLPRFRRPILQCLDWLFAHGKRPWERLLAGFAIETEEQSEPEASLELARKAKLVGDMFGDVGWAFAALEAYRTALKHTVRCSGDIAQHVELNRLCATAAIENCQFDVTEQYIVAAEELCETTDELRRDQRVAAVLNALRGSLYFKLCQYDKSWAHFLKATSSVQLLPAQSVVEILREASRVAVIRRNLKVAKQLIEAALELSERVLGSDHPTHATVLQSYAYYLLQGADRSIKATMVYREAQGILERACGPMSLHLAALYEDLSYSLYVEKYGEGEFDEAHSFVSSSLNIRKELLDPENVQIACSNRVLALIIEEIALNTVDDRQKALLDQALELHLRGLALSKSIFGDESLITAKYHGNLGRLYQTRHMYDKSEQEHIKAIAIKEQIFHEDDYEVALSVGHLASLYTYDMGKYNEAEDLYHRSIKIALELFGRGYSGLEYDYRGLMEIYIRTARFEKYLEYEDKLRDWIEVRDKLTAEGDSIPKPSGDTDVIAKLAELTAAMVA